MVCWQQWVPGAIAAGIIPDVIVDANHSMAYLKYAATWQLLTTTGQDQHNSQQLSSVSVNMTWVMYQPVELNSWNHLIRPPSRRWWQCLTMTIIARWMMIKQLKLAAQLHPIAVLSSTRHSWWKHSTYSLSTNVYSPEWRGVGWGQSSKG